MIDLPFILQVAERLGVPVAMVIVMVLLLLRFSAEHRNERGEWREIMSEESRLNRLALGELSKAVSNIAMSAAFLDGKAGRRRKSDR